MMEDAVPLRPLHILIGLLILALTLVFSALVTAWVEGPLAQEAATAAQDAPASTTTPSVLAPLFRPEVRYWEAHIRRWSQTYGLDPNLIATVMQIESCGDPFARSRAGAMGLFQVMPYHFEEGEDPYDPETNARRGLGYLKRAWEKTGGDVRLSLAAYNGGFRRLQEPEDLWPHETQRYVAWGLGIYQDALAGKARSGTLTQWLARGGIRLCLQARANLNLSAE